jgi:hypothetical protein
VNINDGDLAVTNSTTGSVSIYKEAKGDPTTYSDSTFMPITSFLSYDDKGNLFVDGRWGLFFRFAELPAGSSTFTNIYLNRSVGFPGGVQCEGKYVAIGDREYDQIKPPHQTSAIDLVKVSGSSGTIVSTMFFPGQHNVIQFWIQGKRVVGPDPTSATSDIYSYPGGVIEKTITGNSYPFGAVVSK